MSDYNRGGYPQRRPRQGGGQPSGASRFGPAPGSAPRRGNAPRSRAPAPARRAGPGRPPVRSGAPQPRPRPSGGGAALLPRGFAPLVIVCAAIILAGVVLQCAMPDGFPLITSQAKSPRTTQMITEIHSRGPVRINEIMTSNGGVLTDASGDAPDWVEVANVSHSPVNLKGYVLARNAKAGNVFVFPDTTLPPEGCVIVYADSHLQAEAGEELHAPFRLSAAGDVLMLFNQADVAVDTVNIPALAENTVYARRGVDAWEITDACTPGALNTEENYRAMTSVSGDSDVQIAEVMSSSSRFGPDENGVCHDYVLLRTASGAGADLSGWYLSDTPQLPRKWRFPDGASIPAGGTLLVHCSGLNRTENMEHLHTNFKLSSEGEQVLLSSPEGRLMDQVTFDLIRTDSAYVRAAGGSWSVGTPTAPDAGQAAAARPAQAEGAQAGDAGDETEAS